MLKKILIFPCLICLTVFAHASLVLHKISVVHQRKKRKTGLIDIYKAYVRLITMKRQQQQKNVLDGFYQSNTGNVLSSLFVKNSNFLDVSIVDVVEK